MTYLSKPKESAQIDLFQSALDEYRIKKPIRLIELFAGYGSQALALRYMGVPFEHWRLCEWNWKSNYAYALMHGLYGEHSQGMTKEELIKALTGRGMSSDWNEPMTDAQIARMKETDLRHAYNAIVSTRNTVDVSKTDAEDLAIEREREREHCYLLTYSFPCQDLSLAGKKLGMNEGSNTRSSLLWQVSRILYELRDREERPDVLMMENVPQVHGKGNEESFARWCSQLEELGYSNFYGDLIATDYGIPQTRNRCIMVSIRGEWQYSFRNPFPLEKMLKDFLQDESQVDGKYYLTAKQIECITAWKSDRNPRFEKTKDGIAKSLTTACGRNDFNCNYVKEGVPIVEATKKGYRVAEDGDGVYINNINGKRGTIQKGMVQTIKTSVDVGVVNQIGAGYGGSQAMRVVSPDNSAPTLTTCEGGWKQPLIPLSQTEVIGKKTNCGGFRCNSEVYGTNHSIGTLDCTNFKHPKTIGIETNKRLSETIEKNELNEGEVKALDLYNQKARDEAPTLTLPNHNTLALWNGYAIRKLTPRECFRLMGVKDEDFDRIKDEFSDSTLYHLVGDSIVTTVIMAALGNMVGKEIKETKI